MSARRPPPATARRRRTQLEVFAWWPTPPDYARAPELAVLAVLAAALDLVGRTLIVAHPELGDTERPCWRPLPPTVPAAATVLRHLDRLQRALVAYRHAALIPPPPPPPSDPDDIPF